MVVESTHQTRWSGHSGGASSTGHTTAIRHHHGHDGSISWWSRRTGWTRWTGFTQETGQTRRSRRSHRSRRSSRSRRSTNALTSGHTDFTSVSFRSRAADQSLRSRFAVQTLEKSNCFSLWLLVKVQRLTGGPSGPRGPDSPLSPFWP